MTDRSLVVFDFDGTLVDSQGVLDRGLDAFSALHSLPYDFKKMQQGYIDPYRYDLGWGLPLEKQPAMLKAFDDYMEKMHQEHEEFAIPFYDGIRQQLDIVLRHHDVAVVTARQRRSFLSTLRYHDVTEIFPVYRTLCCAQERGYAIKPAPDALLCVLKETGHRPENTLMIGDTTSDILMARHAGVKSLAVMWGCHDRSRLQEAKPTDIVEHITEFADRINALLA